MTDQELPNTLKYVRPGSGFVPNFDMYSKTKVNGKDEIDLFKWLKRTCPRPHDMISAKPVTLWSPIRTTDIEWNFEKFLLDHKGNVVKRYSERSPPLGWEDHITTLMTQCHIEKRREDENAL